MARKKLKVPRRVLFALKALRNLGYFARWKWLCCQGCGMCALPEGTTKYVFAHAQDVYAWRERGICHLSWGGDGKEIMTVLKSAGLFPEWDGSERTRILIRSVPATLPV